jgi:hypothetical protein
VYFNRAGHQQRQEHGTRGDPQRHPRHQRLQGREGTYELDKNGDSSHGYNVVKNEGGKVVFIKRVDFPIE